MLLWRTSHLPEQRFHLSFNRCDFKGIYTQALVCRWTCLQTTTCFTQFCPGLALLLWQNDSVAQDTSHYFRVLGAHEKSSIFLNFSINLLWPIKNTEASKGSLGERSKARLISFSCPKCFQGKFIASICNKVQQGNAASVHILNYLATKTCPGGYIWEEVIYLCTHISKVLAVREVRKKHWPKSQRFPGLPKKASFPGHEKFGRI